MKGMVKSLYYVNQLSADVSALCGCATAPQNKRS